MDNNDKLIAAISGQGMLPLFYHDDGNLCLSVVRALYETGIRVIEFTNRGPQALSNFSQLLQARDVEMKDLLLAIGTIRTADQAKKFIDAGADMLISPVFDEDVADMAYLHKKLWIPGCMTPTEIHMAEHAGCNLVKLFPGNVLGPAFVSGIRDLFPQLHMMPTGGVEVEEKNLSAWFQAGVCAVGMGSKLVSREILEQRDFATLKKRTSEASTLIKNIRANKR